MLCLCTQAFIHFCLPACATMLQVHGRHIFAPRSKRHADSPLVTWLSLRNLWPNGLQRLLFILHKTFLFEVGVSRMPLDDLSHMKPSSSAAQNQTLQHSQPNVKNSLQKYSGTDDPLLM